MTMRWTGRRRSAPAGRARQGCAACPAAGRRGCSGGEPPAADAGEGLRHVVLVSIDTLRADHLGCYGHPFVRSPAIDGLAAEGVLFTQHVSAASTTLASHTSLMTGTHPHTHGARSNQALVDDSNVMLAEVLRDHGFRTAAFIGAAPLDPAFGFGQGFEHYDAEYQVRTGRSEVGAVQRRAGNVTSAALAWLDEQRAGRWRAQDGRLFLFVHYFDVHAPYAAPRPYLGMYRHDDLDLAVGTMEVLEELRQRLFADLGPFDEEGFLERAGRASPAAAAMSEALAAEYAAEVTYTDFHLARLLTALRRKGILDEALVLVTSDHGETLLEHSDVFTHGEDVFETEIRTPLVLRFPDGRFAGRRSARLTSNVDLLPSLLELLGLPVPPAVEGHSFVPALLGAGDERGAVFAEATKAPHPRRTPLESPLGERPKARCVRTERHKLVSRGTPGTWRLYDLERDALEQHDLLRDPAALDTALLADLRRRLAAWEEEGARLRGAEEGRVASEELLRALEALGYADDR